MVDVEIGFLTRPSLIWWVGLAVACGLALYAYHRLAAPLSRRVRLLLRLARGAALILLLLMILGPLLTRTGETAGKPRLSILVDRSSSMALPAGEDGASRSEQAAMAAAALETALGDRFSLEWLGFSETLIGRPEGEASSAWPALGATAIGDALEEALLRQADRPVGGLVLLTDGVHTRGKDPERVARSLPVPVFSIVVGDTTAPQDLLVRQVRAPAIGHAGEPLAVRAVLESHGYEGAAVTVTVREHARGGGRVGGLGPALAERTVHLPLERGGEVEAALEIVPTRLGLTLFEVEARSPEQERVVRNNVRYFAVDVRERKTRLLYIEAEPDWDFAFLKRTLEADTSLAYSYLVRQAPGRWVAYGAGESVGFPTDDDQMAAYAGVVIGHAVPEDLPAGTSDLLARFVRQGGGLMILSGARSGDLEPWHERFGELLPISVRAEPRRGFAQSAVRPTLAGLAHEITLIEDSPVVTEQGWNDLPPVFVPEGAYTTARGAVTLLEARTAQPVRDVPALALAYGGDGRTAVMTARGFWRWDFTAEATGGPPRAAEFWRRLMRWLVEPSRAERFAVRPARSVFQDSEGITFGASLADETHQPVAGARLRLEVEAEELFLTGADSVAASAAPPGALRAELYPEGPPGRYAATLAPLPPGRYRYRAVATLDASGQEMISDGLFWVEPMGPEFFRLGADPRLPALLAGVSGGASVSPSRVTELAELLPERYRPVRVVRQEDLWNHWAVFLMLALLLCGEWVLRRRKGLA